MYSTKTYDLKILVGVQDHEFFFEIFYKKSLRVRQNTFEVGVVTSFLKGQPRNTERPPVSTSDSGEDKSASLEVWSENSFQITSTPTEGIRKKYSTFFYEENTRTVKSLFLGGS